MKRISDIPALAHRERVQTLFTYALGILLVVVYGLLAVRVMVIGNLDSTTKALLLIFALLPPPLCFLLVRVYTQMIEDERVKTLSDAWARCEDEFVTTGEYEKAQHLIQDTSAHPGEEGNRIFLDCARHFVLQRHPTLADLFLGLREGPKTRIEEVFSADRVMKVAKELARVEIRTAGLNREAYNLPILFFAFAYLGGLPLVFPLFEPHAALAPLLAGLVLTDKITVPLMVFQTGFLGGGAYAAFNLISRFLRRDIAPRLFLVSGVRLLLAPLGAFALYLVSPEDLRVPLIDLKLPMADSRTAIVLYLVAGGFPFALLTALAEDSFSRWDFFKKRLMAGKRSTTLVEGVTVFTAQRLGEEGIDVIQHLAFCDPADLSRRTRYAEAAVADWKEQAILYMLTGDCTLPGTPAGDPKAPPPVLYDLLDQRAGIRTMSALMRRIWVVGATDPQGRIDRRGHGLDVRGDVEAFYRELGLLPEKDEAERKLKSEELTFFFSRLCEDALMIDPTLRRLRRGTPGRRDASYADRP